MLAEGGPGVVQTEHEDLNSVLEETDVLYVTRIQKERFASAEVGAGSSTCYVCITVGVTVCSQRSCR